MLAGDPALDFANTLHWRGGSEVDFLPDYRSLAEWAVPGGLLADAERAMVIEFATAWPTVAETAHSAAIALRVAWRKCLDLRTRGDTSPSRYRDSAARLRNLIGTALADPQLFISSDGYGTRVLYLPVARAALAIASLELIPGDRKLGRCEGDPCGGFFLNTSRSKPRRWCSMDSCGNRAKVRGFRSRLVAEEVQEPDR